MKQALSIIRVTHRLPSSSLLRVTQTCSRKQVDFQQFNINPLMMFWLKRLI
jgi:predicted DNA binding CopG/RHH family protein